MQKIIEFEGYSGGLKDMLDELIDSGSRIDFVARVSEFFANGVAFYLIAHTEGANNDGEPDSGATEPDVVFDRGSFDLWW